ncbi:MAG: DUF1272 domain-containing protein [Flavobacteriaceae bacterium]|nr:DUF1272 domain-containing protein [Flavobacteriaceae bacterium]
MLQIRPNCEHCNKDLPYNSDEAMICTFECTFCLDCVEQILDNVCPNCGGDFTKRPIRPKEMLEKYPVSIERIYKSVDVALHREKYLNKNQ